MGLAKISEKEPKLENKTKKTPIPKWRNKRQIAIYAIVSIVLIILGTHGLITLEDKKTIMIFGDQDNANHNISFALTYFFLGIIGIICSWFDFKTYQTRKKQGLFNTKLEPKTEQL